MRTLIKKIKLLINNSFKFITTFKREKHSILFVFLNFYFVQFESQLFHLSLYLKYLNEMY